MRSASGQYFLFHGDLPDGLVLEGDLAIDTETMGLNLLRDRLCILQLSNGDGKAYLVQFDNAYHCPNLINLLSDSARCKIFHYARFDLAAIFYYLKLELTNVFCTKVASKLTRTYTDSHSLRELCREILGVNLSKQQQSSNWSMPELSMEQIDYAAKDVVYLHKIKERLDSELLRQDRYYLARAIFDFLPTCAKLDLMGWDELQILQH
ncbi:Ribonuclease D [Rickettsiales endosymbiont of Paramecium tredecaurelia]|uniref:ribonuclease D n=1 Tax=Candidatus Sarmatiella mevalonica TaxID=2770581 RepID=UPI0019230EE9|nr:ribonuclease D [Candidatus Sarmatiella mevalonica]MBL3285033.1 Ribonuclease D [Candidatus Sarmatiella mevalonica]